MAAVGGDTHVLAHSEQLVDGWRVLVDGAEDVFCQIEVVDREFYRVVDLRSQNVVAHGTIFELESFQVQDENVGHRPQCDHFQGANVLFATLAVPGVHLVELLPLEEFFDAVFDPDVIRKALLVVEDHRERDGRKNIKLDAFPPARRTRQVTPVHALTPVDYDAVVPQQVLPPCFNRGVLVFHSKTLEFFDVRLFCDAVAIFVEAVHQKLAKLLAVVLEGIPKLRRKTRDCLFQQSWRQGRVVSAPHLFQKSGVGSRHVTATAQRVLSVDVRTEGPFQEVLR
mmetsp:Transcript_4857/g.10263  ORF Transcript_4857/g.10263 Transcript_4857/m.10263 type:complete len:282 (+) Transcript_4857:541-1386(+)